MKNCKALFVYSNLNSAYSWSPAVQILSSVLKQKGFTTNLVHIHKDCGIPLNAASIAKVIVNHKPSAVLYTATSFEFEFLNEIAANVRFQNFLSPQVLGGIHATLVPESLALSNFDAYCIGEGEATVLSLMEQLEACISLANIPALLFKKPHEKINIPDCVNVRDLNSLPFYDWEVMDTPKLLSQRNGWLSISFSRGCPYSCTFCVNQALMRVKGRKGYVRKRSVFNSIEELKYLADSYKVKVFNLDDDLLCNDWEWIKDFCTKYKSEIFERYGIKFTINARVDSINDDLVSMFTESGCQEVQIGIESGDEELRNHLIDKRIQYESIIKSFKLLNEKKLNSLAYIIVGLPGENNVTHAKTVSLLAETLPYLIRATFYVPIPNTPLYDYCAKNDMLNSNIDISGHFSEPILRYKNIDKSEILCYKLFMPWEINISLGHNIYSKAMIRFKGMSYKTLLNSLSEILEIDAQYSKLLKNKLHYSYFQCNLNYYVRNNYP